MLITSVEDMFDLVVLDVQVDDGRMSFLWNGSTSNQVGVQGVR